VAGTNELSSALPAITDSVRIDGTMAPGFDALDDTNVFGANPLGSNVGNVQSGVFLGEDSHDNTVGGQTSRHGNLIPGNGGDGVELSGATHDNYILLNLIGSDDSGGSDGIGNLGAGVSLQSGAHRDTVAGNLARDNTEGGYLVERSDHNKLVSNQAIGSATDGFHVASSDHNLFISNESDDNRGYGFFVDEVLANTFLVNECQVNLLGASNQPGIC